MPALVSHYSKDSSIMVGHSMIMFHLWMIGGNCGGDKSRGISKL